MQRGEGAAVVRHVACTVIVNPKSYRVVASMVEFYDSAAATARLTCWSLDHGVSPVPHVAPPPKTGLPPPPQSEYRSRSNRRRWRIHKRLAGPPASQPRRHIVRGNNILLGGPHTQSRSSRVCPSPPGTACPLCTRTHTRGMCGDGSPLRPVSAVRTHIICRYTPQKYNDNTIITIISTYNVCELTRKVIYLFLRYKHELRRV